MSAATTAPAIAPTTVPAHTRPMTRREIMEALSGLLLMLFIAMISVTVIANALPRIIVALGGTQSQYTWVVTAALLTATVATPIWGKLSDLFSTKVIVQSAIVVFVLASTACGLAQSTGQLIAARAVQGLGIGGLQALVQVVIAAMIPSRERGRYNGYLGGVIALATVSGPLVGGVFVDTSWLGWRWCFLIAIPFAMVALVLLQKSLRLPAVRRPRAKVDYLGATLITAGVGVLLIWVTTVHRTFAWLSWQTAAMVGGGVALLALAVRVESRAAEPIVPLRVVLRRTPALAILTSMATGMAMFGGAVFLAQYLQLGRGYSPTKAGLLTIPMMAATVIASTIAGLLIAKSGAVKPYIVAGAVVLMDGLAALALIDHATKLSFVVGAMTLVGVGIGLSMQNLVLAVRNTVARRDIGAASGTVTFFWSLGATIGVSVLGAVLTDRVDSDVPNHLAAAGFGGTNTVDLRGLPAPVVSIIRAAYGDTIADLFLISAIVAVVGVVAALALPRITVRSSADLVRPRVAKPASRGLKGSVYRTASAVKASAGRPRDDG